MKRCLPAILITICLTSLTWAGCSSPSPYEQGLIRYNDEWVTVEEYEQMKGDTEPSVSEEEVTLYPPVGYSTWAEYFDDLSQKTSVLKEAESSRIYVPPASYSGEVSEQIQALLNQPIEIPTTEYEFHPSFTLRYVGSVNSNIYHEPDCYWAKKIKPENEIWFYTANQAHEQGYRPCKVCDPCEPLSPCAQYEDADYIREYIEGLIPK